MLTQEEGVPGLPSTLEQLGDLHFVGEVERLREVKGRVGAFLLMSCPVLAHLCQEGLLLLLSPWLQVKKLRFREVESFTRK